MNDTNLQLEVEQLRARLAVLERLHEEQERTARGLAQQLHQAR